MTLQGLNHLSLRRHMFMRNKDRSTKKQMKLFLKLPIPLSQFHRSYIMPLDYFPVALKMLWGFMVLCLGRRMIIQEDNSKITMIISILILKRNNRNQI